MRALGVIFEFFDKNARHHTIRSIAGQPIVGVSQGSTVATRPDCIVTKDAGQSFQPVAGQPLNGYYLNTGVQGPDGALYLDLWIRLRFAELGGPIRH